MRCKYSRVRASIAGSFVFPIHATFIFTNFFGVYESSSLRSEGVTPGTHFRVLGFPGRKNYIGAEANLIPHPILLHRERGIGTDSGPICLLYALDHGAERSGNGARIIKNFVCASWPRPAQILGRLLHLVKSRIAE